jgi:dTDP-4-dehydrorhamnose 3,5-epimerase
LGIDWPIGEDAAIRSDKDRGHPPLAALAPMEV